MFKIMNKKKNEIVTTKRKDKLKSMCAFLVNDKGDFRSHTNIAHEIKVHPDTVKDFADVFDTMREAGIQTIRDRDGKLLKMGATDEFLDMIKEMREMRKDMLDIKTSIAQLKR